METAQITMAEVRTSEIQILDGRPIILYAGPDHLLHTNRNEITEAINDRRTASKEMAKANQQFDQLAELVMDWANERKERISSIVGTCKLGGAVVDSELPRVKVKFYIVQTGEDEIDEQLWLELADFDMRIAKDPKFSNVRMNVSAMPFIERTSLIKHLERQ